MQKTILDHIQHEAATGALTAYTAGAEAMDLPTVPGRIDRILDGDDLEKAQHAFSRMNFAAAKLVQWGLALAAISQEYRENRPELDDPNNDDSNVDLLDMLRGQSKFSQALDRMIG